MNITETTHALALAQAYDNRTVGEVNIRAWHAILSDCDAADVMEAIRQHYAESTEWMMPAHIRRAVRDMVSQRDMVRRATGWAPGQAGVPKDEAMPEVTGRPDENGLAPSVRAMLESVRVDLPEGSREALMPRRVAWEREYRAFVRTRDAQPNPLYRPAAAVDAKPMTLPTCPVCQAPILPEQEWSLTQSELGGFARCSHGRQRLDE